MGLGFFKHGNNLLLIHGREIIKEVINSVTSLQIVNQGLKRHARSHKHRRATKDFRIGMDNYCHERIVSLIDGQLNGGRLD